MKGHIALVSAIYGDYDSLKPLPEHFGHSAYMVTDNPKLIDQQENWSGPRWMQIVDDQSANIDPRLRAVGPKCQPWLWVPEYEWYVWLDGSNRVINPNFLMEAVEYVDDRGGSFGCYRHPWRDDIWHEAMATIALPKWKDSPVLEYTANYLADGHQRHSGLWHCSTLVWRNCGEAQILGTAWLSEIQRTTVQDQISLPVVLRKFNMRPIEFPHSIINNPWTVYNLHSDGS